MTENDLTRIAVELAILIPAEYRNLMLARAEELRSLTYEIDGEKCGWFDETLYLDTNFVIDVNRIERQPDSGTGYAFPDWRRTFFIVGSNGGGDYYCLRLDGKKGVWMIGSDCGDEPTKIAESLISFVDDEVQEFREQTQ